jgi:hypothetical protein
MYRFHITVHVRPPEAIAGDLVELDGQPCRPLCMPPAAMATPFPVSFEEASESLAALPRLFIEPDGSFVWVADDAQRTWQVDGSLYDGGTQVSFVELKGTCPADSLDRLLSAFGWPDIALAFQLMRCGIYLGEEDFRRHAESGVGLLDCTREVGVVL